MSTMGLNQKSITENYLENLQIIGNKITHIKIIRGSNI